MSIPEQVKEFDVALRAATSFAELWAIAYAADSGTVAGDAVPPDVKRVGPGEQVTLCDGKIFTNITTEDIFIDDETDFVYIPQHEDF